MMKTSSARPDILWARAIQGRDGAGHLFRGRVTLTAEEMRTLVDTLGGLTRRRRHGRPRPARPVVEAPKHPGQDPVHKVTGLLPPQLRPPVLPKVTAPPLPDTTTPLLDYLLKP